MPPGDGAVPGYPAGVTRFPGEHAHSRTGFAPVQAVVIPIADRHAEYAHRVRALLRERGLRVEVDDSNERMNAKIRRAQLQRVPYMLVVGDREAEAEAANEQEAAALGGRNGCGFHATGGQ